MKKLTLLILLCGGFVLGTHAQQTPLYSQYFLNPYLYNPATVGFDGEAKAFFLYRKQWVGVEGAPETQAFTIDGQLKNERVGLGLFSSTMSPISSVESMGRSPPLIPSISTMIIDSLSG
ncbi:MAG: type IX secretion system membrane protein PorP/SprF [Bacteroidota bacterium]